MKNTGKKTFIISELGINHNGSVELCKEMIRESKAAGVDAVKLQILSPKKISNKEEIILAQEKADLSVAQIIELERYSRSLEIELFSSIGDVDSLGRFAECGFGRAKISSSNLLNYPLHEELIKIGCPVILSTGDCLIEEIADVVDLYTSANVDTTVLYCVPSYPTDPSEICLDAIRFLRERCGTPVGFSDHTRTLDAAVAAVGAGATVIEKHFTLDRRLEGPDQAMSLEPAELCELVARIRRVDLMVRPAEPYFLNEVPARIKVSKVRRAIVMLEDRAAGHVIRESDLIVSRPECVVASALHPKNYRSLIGKRLKRPVTKFSALCHEHF
jgi:N,N'-diacetyllegionaminate synthase